MRPKSGDFKTNKRRHRVKLRSYMLSRIFADRLLKRRIMRLRGFLRISGSWRDRLRILKISSREIPPKKMSRISIWMDKRKR